MSVLTLDPDVSAEELSRRGRSLTLRGYDYFGATNVDQLNEALDYFAKAVSVSSATGRDEILASRLCDLLRCRHRLYERTSDIAHLNAAISIGRQSLEVAPAGSDNALQCVARLSESLSARFFAHATHDRKDLLDSINVTREALSHSDSTLPNYGDALCAIASRLAEFNEHVERNDAYLDESIHIGEQLLELGIGARGAYALNLALDLKTRFMRYGKTDDLHRAREWFRLAVETFPGDHKNHASAVRQYADCITLIAERTNNPAMLEEALTKMSSLNVGDLSDSELVKYYNSQSTLYSAKYEAHADLIDLNLAVQASQDALNLSPAPNGVRAAVLENLSSRLAVLGQVLMDVSIMDAAIDHAREAVMLSAVAPVQQSGAYTTLAYRLSSRYALFGGHENLHQALEARQSALELLPENHYDRPTRMHNLAISYREHHDESGSLDSLDHSIALERAAYEVLHANDDPDQAMVLQGLGLSLSIRSKRIGSDQDFNDAVRALEMAVESCQPGSVAKYTYLNTLANKLTARGERHGNIKDLDAAVAAIEEATKANTGDASSELIYLVTQSNCLAARHGLTGSLEDLDGSLAAAETAYQTTPSSHPSRLGFLHNIGMRLDRKSDLAQDPETKRAFLQRAYDIELKVTDELPEDHPDVPIYLQFLAKRKLFLAAYMDASDEAALLEQLRQAAEIFSRAFGKVYGTPVNRITNGSMAANCWMGLGRWDKASEILSETVQIFRLASPVALAEQDRQRQLRGLSGTSTLACTSFIALGKPEAALEVFEAGRGIMANIAMGYHADLSPIKIADETLHDLYVALRDSISQAMPEHTTHGADFVKTRFEQLKELEAVESQIRDLPGLEGFQRRMSAQQMIELASQGPIVSLCTTDQRCDAIIATTKGIRVLPLIDLKHADVKKRVPLVVGNARLSSVGPLQLPMANKRMRALLAWLWEKVVRPVLDHLRLLSHTLITVPETRLWWVTSGQLGLLPLHAAGKGQKHPTENVYAHVISSYTPSFAALAFARNCQSRVDPASSNAALVTMPHTPGGLNDLSTEAEASAIRSAFAINSSNHLTELLQPSAADVLHEVRNSTTNILHLACHAEPSLSDPSNTALLFGSDPDAAAPDALAVKKLRRYQSPTSAPTHRALRLAYLSACCTAQQYDLRLMDENIHLAAIFQTLGFPDVVGTLWEADDIAAIVVAGEFYRELLRLDRLGGSGEGNVARALHAAVTACRHRKLERGNAAENALAWASFVHIGA